MTLFTALREELGRRGLAEPTRDDDGVVRADSYRTLDTLDAVRAAIEATAASDPPELFDLLFGQDLDEAIARADREALIRLNA